MSMGGEGPLVIGLDCSTTAAKAVAFDGIGETVQIARRPITSRMPRPGWHEQSAEEWWLSSRDAVREVVQRVGAARVKALGVTHQRESFACLGADDGPLRDAILWLDARAVEEIVEFGSDAVHALSGKPPDVTPAIYKLAWLGRHEPGVLAGSSHIVDVGGYLLRKLVGEYVTSWDSADPLGLVDMQRLRYADELLAIAGVRREQLPELVAPGTVVGRVRSEVAAELGVREELRVVAAGGDGQCAGLGAGVVGRGSAYVSLGTSLVTGVQMESYRWSRAFRTLTSVVPGAYTAEALLSAGGYLVRWFMEKFGGSAADALADVEREARGLPAGADGLISVPYWSGAQTPYWDAHARGVTLGWEGRHGRAHLFRSLLEGVAFELRRHTAALEREFGDEVGSYRVTGGGGTSELWLQVLADVTGRPMSSCGAVEVAALGAAMLANAAVGGEALTAVARRMTPAGVTVSPSHDQHAAYDELFAVYAEIYPRLAGVFPMLEQARPRIATGGDERP